MRYRDSPWRVKPHQRPIGGAFFEWRRAIGRRVQEARESAGMLRADLCRKTGLTGKTLQNMEEGAHSARLENLWRVAETLNLSIERLLEQD